MYTNKQLRDMDKGALVCLAGALQDKICELEESERLRHISADDLSERTREALNQ